MSVWMLKQKVESVKTVGELIEALQEFPYDAELRDDWNNNYSIELLEDAADTSEQYVTLVQSDGY